MSVRLCVFHKRRALGAAAVWAACEANGSKGDFPPFLYAGARLPSTTGIPSMHRGLGCEHIVA